MNEISNDLSVNELKFVIILRSILFTKWTRTEWTRTEWLRNTDAEAIRKLHYTLIPVLASFSLHWIRNKNETKKINWRDVIDKYVYRFWILISNANFSYYFMTTAIRPYPIRILVVFYCLALLEQRANYKFEDMPILKPMPHHIYASVWRNHNATRLLAFFKSRFCNELLQPNSYTSVDSVVMFSCGSFKIKQSPSDYRVVVCCGKCELWWIFKELLCDWK